MSDDIRAYDMWRSVYMEACRRGEAWDAADQAARALKAYREAFPTPSRPVTPYDPESPEAIAARVLANVDGGGTWFRPGEP